MHGKALLDKPDPRIGLGGPAKDTTTCVVADDQGNVVAATPSGFTGALAGKTGVWLGSRLQSFNNWAGHVELHRAGQAAADHPDADASCSRTASRSTP